MKHEVMVPFPADDDETSALDLGRGSYSQKELEIPDRQD